ncbi:MAG: response regulator [Huintestinicola sp.]|uniref:response regulator n=1 Tax=Huintestinicola sp. TaxID=2981661 RepID=UPI003F0F8D10
MNSFAQNTSDQEQAIKRFLRDYLNKPKNEQTLHTILAGTCRYYDADRAYIFELNTAHTEVNNTYEWCREGVSSGMEDLQNIPVEGLESWFEALEEKGEFYISSLSDIPSDSNTYRTLEQQGVSCLAVAPLIVNGSAVGLLGIDNPRRNDSHLLLLSVIASACCSEIINKHLEYSNKALTERMKIIQSMSEIYTSVYYVDIANDRYTELASMDIVHEHIGSSGNARESLEFFCRNMMTPEYTEELLRFVDISTLDERMKQERIISKQFLSTVPLPDSSISIPYWAQCSFIDGGRGADGRLSHVIFVTQTIHDSKIKELETQKDLQEANAELTELLESEKQHTAIIGSMSNVFFALYYIDLEEGSFRDIFSPDGINHTRGEKDDAKTRLSSLVDTWVKDEYRSIMRLFTDIDTIDERLGNNRIITQEYVDIGGDWVRCCLFPAEKNDIGKNTGIICGLRWITAEKEKQESQDNLIQALSLSYENVYAVNMDTSEAVCYRMDKTITSRYGQKFAIGDYEKSIRLYVENDVLEDDRQLFDRILLIKDIQQLLGDRQTYSFSYRVSRNDTIQYFECQLVKPSSSRNEFAVGFKNIDSEKKQELAQQKKIESALAAVEKLNATLRDEMDIAGALSKDYPSVVLLDLVNETAVTIKQNGKIIKEDERVIKRSYNSLWESFILKYVPDEDKAALTAAVSSETVLRALEAKDEYSFSYRVCYDDTGLHHYQASFIRLYSQRDGKSQIILGFRNIDAIVEEERKNMTIREEQLRIIGALSREYHSLFKVDAATGKLSLYRTDGIGMERDLLDKLMEHGSYEEVLSKYIDGYIVPEDRERIRQSAALGVLLERVPQVGLYKLGYRRNMNGTVAYFEMNVVKTSDNNGMVTFIIGLRDVDDEMQRQLRQIREIETQSEIIEGLGSVYYSVLLVDPERDKVTVYRAESEDGKAIAGHFSKNDHCWSKGLCSYAEEHISEKDRREFIEKLSLDNIRLCKEDFSLTYEKLKADGIIYLQARVSFVREKDGGFVVVIGTRNVDDLIKKERQQELALQAACDSAEAANKAKTEFLSNMSHDIRTPMNGIIGMTAIAATHIDDKERVQDCLQKISQASKHMLSLINEVLDMSKIESGKVDLNEEEFNLSNLVDNLLSMTSAQINKHRHELSVNISDVIHEEVIGDSLRIQKVFTNLMSNAVKYTPDGGKIRFSITEKPSGQAKVGCYEFIFEDNGIGMSEEFMEKIFEPFSRAVDGRVNKIQGTGLGMPISRNIVRMMGGDIKVESRLNVGSRFTVTIYLKLQDTAEIRLDRFIDLNVLVVDDDALSLESCCAILEDFGMKPDGVATGAEAVEYVTAKQDYFACILDWKMPDMDGIATTKAIRKAAGKDVPIIIISAYDWSDIEQEARAAGANAFISKPLFRSRLAKTFNALVGEEEQSGQETPLVSLSNMDLSGRRILLAEDNDLNAEIATEILETTGLAVERAADGTEAVDMMAMCGDGYYDIIFMDIQMPRMNGYDATRAIRAMNRNYCKQIPIVAMTANAFAEDVQAAKTVGMNEHIAKPLDLKALSKTLKKWLL